MNTAIQIAFLLWMIITAECLLKIAASFPSHS